MLTNTFCHLPGVGPRTEQALWRAGVTGWDAVLRPAGALPRAVRPGWAAQLAESARYHAARDPAYFGGRLRADQQWRLYGDFRDACAFLDIETTGMGPFAEVTTVALYDGRSLRTYVNGHNLADFPRDVRDYRLLVTYNGKCFDVPVLERYFGVPLPQAHID